MERSHIPVMLSEVVTALSPMPGKIFVDATLGLGGHAEALLYASSSTGRLLGLERTEEGLTEARARLAAYNSHFVGVVADFRNLASVAHEHWFEHVDGALFDLGLASWQIDTGHQGLSFQIDAPLDMRLGVQDPSEFTRKEDDPMQWTEDVALARAVRTWRFRSAAEILGNATEDELTKLFHGLGDVSGPRGLARRIVEARSSAPIEQTSHLVTIVGTTNPKALAPIFQTLRILVNDEYGALVAGLGDAWSILKPGGTLAVISFHSGEDRIVKRMMRSLTDATVGKPLTPSAEEQKQNPRSRSATLRTAQKVLGLKP